MLPIASTHPSTYTHARGSFYMHRLNLFIIHSSTLLCLFTHSHRGLAIMESSATDAPIAQTPTPLFTMASQDLLLIGFIQRISTMTDDTIRAEFNATTADRYEGDMTGPRTMLRWTALIEEIKNRPHLLEKYEKGIL